MFTTEQLRVINYCAAECKHQQSGELSVAGMLTAYNQLHTALQMANEGEAKGLKLNTVHIIELATLIEPRNSKGLRTTPVRFKSGKVIGTANMERRLENLLEAANDGRVTPTEFYKEFQEIHPFEDGNGRLGLILFNFYNQTLDNPAPKPEVVFSP